MNDIQCIFLVIAIALALLLLDRRVRISPFLERQGFMAGRGGRRCGVGMPPCPGMQRCMNGFCRSQDEPELYERNPLPVLP